MYRYGARRDGASYSRPQRCNGCSFCKEGVPPSEDGEAHKRCPVFRELKAVVSRESYLEVKLRPKEEAGFAAAGVLLCRRAVGGELELLMAREYRKGRDQLNFLGGHRKVIRVKAATEAANKLDEETGHCLSRATLRRMRQPGGFPLVLWSAENKYALFLFELTSEADNDVDIQAAGVAGAKRLEWVPRSSLLSKPSPEEEEAGIHPPLLSHFAEEEVHEFAADMVADVARCNVMGRLEELFDCAARAAAAATAWGSSAPDAGTAVAAKESMLKLDVLAALRETAHAARPEAPFLGGKPSWSQLRAAVALLHRSDKTRLQLRFHADKLRHVLGRDAEPQEETIATKNMQVLQFLLDDPPAPEAEATVMATLAELDGLLRPAATASTGCTAAHQNDSVNDLAELLRGIKMSSSGATDSGSGSRTGAGSGVTHCGAAAAGGGGARSGGAHCGW